MIQSEVLAHPIRKRLYRYIANNPGVTFQMLKDMFDINDGTLSYHLDSLRKGDLIDIRKRRNERVYVIRDMADPVMKDLAGRQRTVLRAIRDHPGSNIDELSSMSGMTKKEVSRSLSCLRRKRLVKGRKEGQFHVYHPVGDMALFDEMVLVLVDRYVRGEITLSKMMELKRKLEDLKG